MAISRIYNSFFYVIIVIDSESDTSLRVIMMGADYNLIRNPNFTEHKIRIPKPTNEIRFYVLI